MKFHSYKYIDDTGSPWCIKVSDYLAEAGGLEQIPFGNPEQIGPMGRNYKPRHFKLVALGDRPGMQKYRCDVITNERNPLKLLNKIMTIQGFEMRCVRYVGEQQVGY